MMRSTTWGKSHGYTLLRTIGITAFWIGIWYAAALAVGQEILIPTPGKVIRTLWQLLGTGLFWRSIALSLIRICLGFLSALVVGTLLAILTSRYSLLHALFSPLLHLVRAAPVASFIILTLVWIQTDSVPVFISFLMVLPMVWINVEQGIRQTDPQLLEMGRLYRLSSLSTLRHIYFPSTKPYLISACINGLGFAWKSGVAAEVICRPEYSIGHQLANANSYLETPEVFAWTAVVVVLSLLLERLLLWITGNGSQKAGGAPHDNL